MKVLVVCLVLCVAVSGFAGYIEGKTPSEGKAPSQGKCAMNVEPYCATCNGVSTSGLWPWNWNWTRFAVNTVHYPFDVINRTLEVPASLCPCTKPYSYETAQVY